VNAITPAFPWSNPITSSGWDILNARRLFKEVVVRSHGDEPLASATQGQGIVARSDLDIQVWNPESDTSNYKRVEPGQFVISLRSFQGGFEISNIIGMVSPAYTTLHPLRPELNVFYRHFFKSEAFISAVNSVASGIRQGKAIKFEDFASLSLPVPPVEQAQIIAGYLDQETGRIDALVERLERLIKLLTEKRQAVISHAVTKGLNPDAPMKHSRVDWIGRIPTHWDVWKGSHLFTFKSGLAPDGLTLGPNEKYQYIKVGDLNNGSSGSEIGEASDKVTCSPTNLLPAGTIIFPKRGGAIFTNKVRILAVPALVDTNIMGVLPDSKISTSILARIIQFLSLEELADVSTVPQINNKHIAPIKIPVAPLTEQTAIEQHLKDVDTEFDALTGSAVKALTALRERRAALISAAVTGQIPIAEMTPDTQPEDAA